MFNVASDNIVILSECSIEGEKARNVLTAD
jgi:hypothetical protein